jgi:16S rRNA (cytosine1402-N4)-methyltransferase
MTTPHMPVLAGELIELLDPAPGAIAVDCTVGGAGHARLVAERIGARGTLIGIDRDPLAEERFAELADEVACVTRFIRSDFVSGLAQLRDDGVVADVVYMDLGMSSMQVDTWERGFSYSYEAPLDMRMDPSQELTAAEVVNTWEERRLSRLFRDFGEERFAGPIARAISHARARAELETTQDLVDVIKAAVPVPAQFAGGHPAKRTFQALRIAVNDELIQIDEGLPFDRRPTGCHLVPFARGPPRQALPDREGARLHLPARLPDLRLRPRAGGGDPEPPRDRPDPG